MVGVVTCGACVCVTKGLRIERLCRNNRTHARTYRNSRLFQLNVQWLPIVGIVVC